MRGAWLEAGGVLVEAGRFFLRHYAVVFGFGVVASIQRFLAVGGDERFAFADSAGGELVTALLCSPLSARRSRHGRRGTPGRPSDCRGVGARDQERHGHPVRDGVVDGAGAARVDGCSRDDGFGSGELTGPEAGTMRGVFSTGVTGAVSSVWGHGTDQAR